MGTDDLSRLALLASVIAVTPDAVISVDDEQRIIVFNEGAEQILGYSRNEVLGRPLDLLLPERFRSVHAKHIRDFARSHETARRMGERQEIFALHRDGHEIPAEAAISKLEVNEQRMFTVVLRDITERKKREMRMRFLMHELEHRVNNILSRVKGIIEQTAEGQVTVRDYRDALLARIKALARAQQLLSGASWQGVTIADVIRDQLEPYATSLNVRVEGPEILLNAHAAQALSMVIHELTTNAVKYGALSLPTGRVAISWQRDLAGPTGERLALRWREQCGPEVKTPGREGYGTRVIRELLTYEFDGAVEHRYLPGGATCDISLPLDPLLARPHDQAAGNTSTAPPWDWRHRDA